jgi:TetR/AcrR family transcriptional regulator, lmrAB and yxaGH operons repressor
LFPGGKDELVAEAVQKSGDDVAAILDAVLSEASNPDGVVRDYVSLIESVLAGSKYLDGCPIATVALEVAPHHEELTTIIGLIFAGWNATLQRNLRRVGLTKRRSEMIASLSLAAVEGALVIARSQQSTDIFKHSLEGLTELARATNKPKKAKRT